MDFKNNWWNRKLDRRHKTVWEQIIVLIIMKTTNLKPKKKKINQINLKALMLLSSNFETKAVRRKNCQKATTSFQLATLTHPHRCQPAGPAGWRTASCPWPRPCPPPTWPWRRKQRRWSGPEGRDVEGDDTGADDDGHGHDPADWGRFFAGFPVDVLVGCLGEDRHLQGDGDVEDYLDGGADQADHLHHQPGQQELGIVLDWEREKKNK